MQTNRFIERLCPLLLNMEGKSATDRDHQSDYWYISSPVSDVVETDKDSSLLVSAIFTVISMFRIQ